MLNFSHKNTKCSGRTMIEMIGVLAIIGVLSIGGLFGYKIAMNYHRANETIHDVMLRATNVPMKWEDYAAINDANHQFKFTDLKPYEEVNPMGYTVKVWLNLPIRIMNSEYWSKMCLKKFANAF